MGGPGARQAGQVLDGRTKWETGVATLGRRLVGANRESLVVDRQVQVRASGVRRMSVAERTREAVRARPFLRDALAAGVVNYAAAAESLDVAADREAVAAALRRYETELTTTTVGDARVRLHRGIDRVESDPGNEERAAGSDDRAAASERETPILVVGGTRFTSDGGRLAAVLARGSGANSVACERVLSRLRAADVTVEAAAVGSDTVAVVVPGRESATALRVTEAVFE